MSDAAAEEKTESTDRNWVKIILITALLLLLLWLGIKTWRIGSALYSLWQIQAEARTLLDGGITSIPADDAEQMVLDARQDILTLKAETAFLMPVTEHLGWVPQLGPLLINAPAFMEMADAGTETAAYAVRGLKPALTLMQSEGNGTESRLPQLVGVIESARPDLAQAAVSLNRVADLYENLERTEDFPTRLQPALALADEILPLAQDGLKVAQVLPQIAGADAPKTYLILAQNDDELRATGGFITGAGVLTVDNGRIVDLAFQDASLVDSIDNGAYDYPPAPMQQFMGLDYFVFRDANYWPDFPTSAENAIRLFTLGQDVDPAQFDGVIAIDQPFLSLLLAGTGPIQITDSDVTLTSDNIISTLQDTWVSLTEVENARVWLSSRKDFLAVFAREIRNRLENDLASVDLVTLGRNMYQAVETKRMQLYFRDPAVMAVIDEVGWNGRLENPFQQDYLMVVDSNSGYNKANIYITREIKYDITLDENGSGEAVLTVTHNHRGPASEAACDQNTQDDYAAAQDYLEIADQCYFNYLRVYTPVQTTLISSTKQSIQEQILLSGQPWESTALAIPELANFNTFGNFMVLPRAQSMENSFQYQLPQSVVQTSEGESIYRLQLQKQAGLETQQIHLTITLPANAQFVRATPELEFTHASGNQIIFELDMKNDLLIEVVYQ